MTRTELLSLADRLDAHAEVHEQHFPQDEEQRQWAADLRAQAAMNRKLAELRQEAWKVKGGRTFQDGVFIGKKGAEDSVARRRDKSTAVPLYQLSEVLQDD